MPTQAIREQVDALRLEAEFTSPEAPPCRLHGRHFEEQQAIDRHAVAMILAQRKSLPN